VPRYLLHRRLERARALLGTGGEATVAEVAARCGFASAAHFSHRFKERYGLRATDVLREARVRP
jgi:transcriptional regulator GlxA family with amidase domain